jgi:hypothetical protein
VIGNNERRVTGPCFARSLPDNLFLCAGIVLKLFDQALLVIDLLHQRCVFVFQLTNHLAFIIESAQALAPAQHDGSVGCQADKPAENDDRT